MDERGREKLTRLLDRAVGFAGTDPLWESSHDPNNWWKLRELVDALTQATTDEEMAMLAPGLLPQLYAVLHERSDLLVFCSEQMWADARKAVARLSAQLDRWQV